MATDESQEGTTSNTHKARSSLPHSFFVLSRSPRVIIWGLLFYAGVILYFFSSRDSDIQRMVLENWPKYLGILLSVISVIFMMVEFLRSAQSRSPEKRFIDVDTKQSTSSDLQAADLDKLIAEVRQLKESRAELNLEAISQLLQDQLSQTREGSNEQPETFIGYFTKIRELLERKADVSDQKASILLDRGIAYSKGGIVFFIIAIISWQILSWIKGFQVQFIYGIVSCSLLFIFIEFLSAWFLTQYRHFVDTSTYIIKVKALFDRYLLTYLATKEYADEKTGASTHAAKLFSILHEDVKWPDQLKAEKGIGFANDAMESLADLAKAIKTLKSKTEEKDEK